MFFERRKYERHTVKNCTVVCSSGRWSHQGEVLNISEGGMQIIMDEVPDMHSELRVFMTCEDGQEIAREGLVVWLIKNSPPKAGSRFGLEFK
jgi:hypothetical protein